MSVQYATGEEQKKSSRKTASPKWKGCSIMDVSHSEIKVQYCQEKHCIETLNVKSVYQYELDVVKQDMARLNINILGISEIKWIGEIN